jgi:hypothetical protein
MGGSFVLSSDISIPARDELFSSILNRHICISEIREPDPDLRSRYTDMLKEKELENYNINQASFFASDHMHGPFVRFLDNSQKYDFLGKKDLNIIGYSNPVLIKAELNTEEVTLDQFKNCYRQQFNTLTLKVNMISDSQSETILRALATISKEIQKPLIFTFSNSFLSSLKSDIDILQIDKDYNWSKTEKSLNSLISQYKTRNIVFAFEFQNEKSFNFLPDKYYLHLKNWCNKNSIPIWINESYGFGRGKFLFKTSTFPEDFNPSYLTFGNAPMGYYFLSQNTESFDKLTSVNLSSIKNFINTISFLKDGGFWGENGRISEIEKLFQSGLLNLKSKFKNIEFDSSGNLIHIGVNDKCRVKSMELSNILFENGILVGIHKSEQKWIRLKLPTSLKNEQIKQILEILSLCLSKIR